MNSARVAIAGATGYSGEELIRLLIRHPETELVCVTSRGSAGEMLGSVFPRFRGQKYGELKFSASEVEAIVASGAQVVFLALPHGAAAPFAQALLAAGVRVIGCYTTSVILPLRPLLAGKLIEPGSIVVSSMSGVSGAGRNVAAEYLYAECNENARPYGVPKHRHLGEIEQELSVAAGEGVIINFTPHLIPVTRGILTTTYAMPRVGVAPAAIDDALEAAYGTEAFVRLQGEKGTVELKNVTFTNFLDIAWRHDPRTGRVVLMSAEDNLVKGAAGQAVQNMNAMCGWPETTGL
jgi:N-acetyl-gamma-glutamyl-phosphate reductase